MSFELAGFLHRLRFTAACLAMLVAIWTTLDLHSHQTGLHAPAVCSICALEKAAGSGFAPVQAFVTDAVIPVDEVSLPEQRLQAIACRRYTFIRAPPRA